MVMDIFFEDLSYTESSMEEAEVLDWYKMSPAERFVESQKLWEVFLLFGGDYGGQWGPMGSNLSS